MPLAVETLELVSTAVLEPEAARLGDRACHIRDEDLARSCRRHDARGLMHGHAADVVVDELDLAEVHARPHLQTVPMCKPLDRKRTAERLRRTVEGREEAVAGRLDLATAVALELRPRSHEVLGEEPTPPRVSDLGRRRCRVDEVREEHRREYPVATSDQEAVEERAVPGKQDLHAWFLADRVTVVPRCDLEHVIWPIHDLGSIRVHDPELPR